VNGASVVLSVKRCPAVPIGALRYCSTMSIFLIEIDKPCSTMSIFLYEIEIEIEIEIDKGTSTAIPMDPVRLCMKS
jgi:hypothetical protein